MSQIFMFDGGVILSMKRTICVGVAAALLCCPAIGEEAAPEAFRGISWGQNISSIKDQMIPIAAKDEVRCYKRKNEKLKVGEADVVGIEYCFYSGEFYSATVSFSGYENFQIIRDALNRKYGEGRKLNRYLKDYLYTIPPSTTAFLDLNEITDDGTVYYRFNEIPRRTEEEQNRLDKEAEHDL